MLYPPGPAARADRPPDTPPPGARRVPRSSRAGRQRGGRGQGPAEPGAGRGRGRGRCRRHTWPWRRARSGTGTGRGASSRPHPHGASPSPSPSPIPLGRAGGRGAAPRRPWRCGTCRRRLPRAYLAAPPSLASPGLSSPRAKPPRAVPTASARQPAAQREAPAATGAPRLRTRPAARHRPRRPMGLAVGGPADRPRGGGGPGGQRRRRAPAARPGLRAARQAPGGRLGRGKGPAPETSPGPCGSTQARPAPVLSAGRVRAVPVLLLSGTAQRRAAAEPDPTAAGQVQPKAGNVVQNSTSIHA